MRWSHLQQFAADVRSVPVAQYDDLVRECRDLAVQLLDVRYMVLGECFDLAITLWGSGEAAAVSTERACALVHAWDRYVRAILDVEDEETATALALALRAEIGVLAGS